MSLIKSKSKTAFYMEQLIELNCMWAHILIHLRYKLFLLISLLFATIFMANKTIKVQYSYEFCPYYLRMTLFISNIKSF